MPPNFSGPGPGTRKGRRAEGEAKGVAEKKRRTEKEGKEKKKRGEKGKRRSEGRTPKSSSASGPKKPDTGSCTKTRKESQKADGGLVEEATIWYVRAENRVDADPKLAARSDLAPHLCVAGRFPSHG